MWAALAAIGAPIITAVFGLIQGRAGSGLQKRLKEHAALAKDVSGNPEAKKALDELIKMESEALLAREKTRLARTLNVANLVLAILLLIVSTAAIYGATIWTQAVWALGWGWLPVVVSVPLVIFLLALTATGFTSLYKPAAPRKKTTK